jgi:CcdB protein
MSAFDICPIAASGGKVRVKQADLVVILQHDRFDLGETIVVAPLLSPATTPPMDRLRFAVKLNGRDYVLAIDRLAAIDRRAVQPAVANVAHLGDDIRRAFDFVFFGT